MANRNYPTLLSVVTLTAADNVLAIKQGGTTYECVITAGSYFLRGDGTSTDLCKAIKDAIEGEIGGTWTVGVVFDVDATNPSAVVTISNASAFQLMFADVLNTFDSAILGFTDANTSSAASAASTLSSICVWVSPQPCAADDRFSVGENRQTRRLDGTSRTVHRASPFDQRTMRFELIDATRVFAADAALENDAASSYERFWQRSRAGGRFELHFLNTTSASETTLTAASSSTLEGVYSLDVSSINDWAPSRPHPGLDIYNFQIAMRDVGPSTASSGAVVPDSSVLGVIGIENGGTGADNAVGALANLGGVSTSRTLTGTAPITIDGVSGSAKDLSANRTIAHADSGVTAAQNPTRIAGFKNGLTTADAKGHVTALAAVEPFLDIKYSRLGMFSNTGHFSNTSTSALAQEVGLSSGVFPIVRVAANSPSTQMVHRWCGTSGSDMPIIMGGSFGVITRQVIRLSSLPASGTTIDVFGLMNTLSGGSLPSDGVYWAYDSTRSANWLCVTSNGGTRTITTTSIFVGDGIWQDFRIEVAADLSSAKFYSGDTLIATHTTNLPSSSTGMTITCGIYRTQATAGINLLGLSRVYGATF